MMRIEDSRLGKYEIRKEGLNYTVYENTGKVDKKGKELTKTHGYHSSVPRALNKIVKLMVEIDITYSLKEYLTAIEAQTNRIIDLYELKN